MIQVLIPMTLQIFIYLFHIFNQCIISLAMQLNEIPTIQVQSDWRLNCPSCRQQRLCYHDAAMIFLSSAQSIWRRDPLMLIPDFCSLLISNWFWLLGHTAAFHFITFYSIFVRNILRLMNEWASKMARHQVYDHPAGGWLKLQSHLSGAFH